MGRRILKTVLSVTSESPGFQVSNAHYYALAKIIVEAIDEMVSFFMALGTASVVDEGGQSANTSETAGPAQIDTQESKETLRAIYLDAIVSILGAHGADRIIELLADWGTFQHRAREMPGPHVWVRLALMVTAYLGRVPELKALLQLHGVDPASTPEDDWIFPPLMSAGLGGYFNTVKLLVREGVSLEARNGIRGGNNTPDFGPLDPRDSCGGENVLHFAALGGHVKLVRFVLREWEDAVEAVDNHGHTPLIWALASGQTAAARELLEWRDGDPKERKKQAMKGEKKVKKKNKKTRNGEILSTPSEDPGKETTTEAAALFRFALRSQRLDPVIETFPRILEQEETLIAVAEWGTPEQLRHLLSLQKTPMTYRSAAGATVLHHAIYSGNCEKVRMVLEQPGVDINVHAAARLDEATPLHAACDQTPEVVKLILACHDVHLLSLDSSGRTPLMAAVGHARQDICDLLLELSDATDLWRRDFQGRTILSIAATTQDERLVRRLLELAPAKEVVSEAISYIDDYLAGPKRLPKKLQHLGPIREAQERVRKGTYRILVQYREQLGGYLMDA
jgi:ankyrin repeat protein